MKPLLILALLLELMLAGVMSSGTCLLRGDMVHAIRAARENPSAQARAELQKQHWSSIFTQLGFVAVLFGALALPTVLLMRRPPCKVNPVEEADVRKCS